jgi:hypothetical protein
MSGMRAADRVYKRFAQTISGSRRRLALNHYSRINDLLA